MKYSLAVPFMQRVFDLACENGFTGQITANSFMKREFGKKLITEFLPTVDLTHVIDTSGAYIPGHGTPTVILFGRHRRPITSTLRTVMGIRGEPSTPVVPDQGNVWTSILNQIEQAGSQSAFVSVRDSPRENFHRHPWSIGGGGASELKEQLDRFHEERLSDLAISIGPASFAGVDDMFSATQSAFLTRQIPNQLFKTLILGDSVRDYIVTSDVSALTPYNEKFDLLDYDGRSTWGRYVWLTRSHSEGMISFNRKTRRELNESWWSWYRWIPERYRTSLSILFSEVASHNHFALDRGGNVFSRTAPAIKLPATATEDEHLGLLGLLNSSTACFWMKQVSQIKTQTTGMDSDAWQLRRAFDSTKLKSLPLPEGRPLALARRIDSLAHELVNQSPCRVLARWDGVSPLGVLLSDAKAANYHFKVGMIALQEDLDWQCYGLYGLIDDDLIGPPTGEMSLGHRAFEIVLARKMRDESLQA